MSQRQLSPFKSFRAQIWHSLQTYGYYLTTLPRSSYSGGENALSSSVVPLYTITSFYNLYDPLFLSPLPKFLSTNLKGQGRFHILALEVLHSIELNCAKVSNFCQNELVVPPWNQAVEFYMPLSVMALSLTTCVGGHPNVNGSLTTDSLTTAAGEMCICCFVDQFHIISYLVYQAPVLG